VGLALLVGVAPAGASPLLVTLLAGACLWVIRRARDSYVVALEEKLRISPRTTHVGVPSELEVADKVTLDSLVRALHSQDGTQVRTALSILRRSSRFRLEEHLQSLLTHEDEAVRMMALDLVPAHPSPEVEFVLASILSLDRRRPRAAAARALARCQPHRAGQVLGPYLHDPDPGVACAVIAALFPLEDCRAAARARLEDLLAQRALADAMLRRELARLLGDLPPLEALPVLPALVGDDESSVRALALRSAGALCARAAQEGAVDVALAVVPFLEQRLAVRSDRGAARSALAQLGDHVVPLLRQNLDDRTLPLGVRIEIPRILRAIGTRAAGQAMLFSNVRDHPSLRWRTAESIFQLRRQHPDVELDLGRANQACLRRLAGFSHYRPLCHALALADETAPKGGQARRAWDVLRHATTDRLLQNLEMAVRLLGLHRGVERMDRVAEQLVVAERAALDGIPYAQVASGRADALEVLDVALRGDDLHSDVMRVLEPPPPIATAEGPANLPWRTVADTARALRCSADPLVAALAHRVLRSGLLMPDEASIPKEMPPPPSPDDGALVSDPTDHAELDMDDALVTKILALEKVDLFSGLPVDDVAAIASIAVERHAEAGEVLYREGDPGETMMVLISGTVSLSRAGRAYMKMGPGESIGQVSLLDRGPRPTTAVVSDPLGAELLTIGCDAFIDLVTDRPELMRGLFGVLAKRLRALIDMQAGRVEA
jgi:HEAT repeat protein